MNWRLAFSLMTLSTVTGSLFTVGLFSDRAFAANRVAGSQLNPTSCDLPPDFKQTSHSRPLRQGILVASTNPFSNDSLLDFTDAESDAAAILFGCDCSSCIRALRQLQSQPLLEKSSGHCWTSMERRVSPQRMQEVLKGLETQK